MNTQLPLFIGLDFGTDSVRAILVDADGARVAESVCAYPRWSNGRYSDAAAGMFRQHPLDYIEGMTTVIRDVVTHCAPEDVAGIGVDTTASTPCVTDANGTPLALFAEFSKNPNAMFVLWKDHTAIEEERRINAVARDFHGVDYTAFEGGSYSCEWLWSKLLHVVRADAHVREAAAGVVEHCDWIPALLTGEKAKPGRCTAGHKALWHASWGGLPPVELFGAIDPLLTPFRRSRPTDSYTADVKVGTLSREWAERLGLTEKVAVSGGMIDCHAGAVGANIGPNKLVKVCGTSTCDIIVAKSIDRCIPGICGQVDGSVVPGMIGFEAGQPAFGDVYAWLKRFLGYAGEVSVAAIEKDAAKIAPGSTGIVALDWFNGRRSPYADVSRTGAIAGLNLGSTVPMVYRALAEATVFGAKAITDHFAAQNVPVKDVVMTGGISRKSPFVMQLFADIFNMPVKVAACEQTCALGSAIFASVAAGCYKNVPEAMAHMAAGTDLEYAPDAAAVPVYAELYMKYRELGAKGSNA